MLVENTELKTRIQNWIEDTKRKKRLEKLESAEEKEAREKIVESKDEEVDDELQRFGQS